MLQILIEAGCLEWATIVSIVLQDAMAIIRIVNAARSGTEAQSVVERLHDGFLQIEHSNHKNLVGYSGFINSIQPQIKTLEKFLTALMPPAANTQPNQAASQTNQLKPPVQKHTTPPIRPTLPRTLSDPVNAHGNVSNSPPQQASTPKQRPASLSDNDNEDLHLEPETDPGSCIIS